MTEPNVSYGRKRHAIFAVHGISPFQRYAFQDWVAGALQSYLNRREEESNSGLSWGAVVHWPHVAAQEGETVRPSALRIHRNDLSPDNHDGITYDVYEGYWSPLSKGRTSFRSALNWLFTATFAGTSSTANIPCTLEKLVWDLTYVALLLGVVLVGLLLALAAGLSAWGVFIHEFVSRSGGSVSYLALLKDPIGTALQLPFLAYLELGVYALAAYVLAQICVMYYVGSARRRRTTELWAQAEAGGTFRSKTIAANVFHRYASAVLWTVFVLLVLAAVGVDQMLGRITGHVGWWHAGAAALVVLSALFFQFARSMADFAVEDVLGDVQIYTTRDTNSEYYSIREQIVQTVSDALIGVLRTTEPTDDARPIPYYDSIHIFGHSLGSTVALDVLIRLRQLLQEQTLADTQWGRIRSFTTFGTALEKTRFFFDMRNPSINAAQDQWENDVYGRYFTKDQTVLGDPDNRRGIYWSNLWYLRDIVANAIVSYRSDVSVGSSFEWARRSPGGIIKNREICENHMLPHPRPLWAWLHGDYLQDQLFWDRVWPVVT